VVIRNENKQIDPLTVIREILRVRNHGSQKLRDPNLVYNYGSQKLKDPNLVYNYGSQKHILLVLCDG